ncbi:MAG: hypothetical protein IJZ82_08510 [Lachnospiraceae bacterium]|nr:hypothetical protein [Lachnospiraceae bacterium]
MKHKKLIALLAASVMAMSSMTVLAEEGKIEGDMNYVNTTIYKVELPTTDGMSFILDPQGLTSLDAGAYDSDEAGKIVAEGTMVAKNFSSVDVYLTADFFVEDSDTASPVALKSAIDADDEKQLALTITTTDTTTPLINVTADAAGAATEFKMDKATYNYTGNATEGYAYTLDDSTGSKLEMTIGGTIAKEYDWSAYTDDQTLTLNAVFKFVKASGSTDEVENTVAAPVTPTTDDYVMAANDDGTVSYTFVDAPDGTLTALTVDGVAKNGAITAGNVTYEDGVLSFNTTSVAGTGIGNAGDHTISVTIGGEVVELTYTAS